MPEVLSLIDKKVTTIFTPYDFEELVDKYMGVGSSAIHSPPFGRTRRL